MSQVEGAAELVNSPKSERNKAAKKSVSASDGEMKETSGGAKGIKRAIRQ